MKYWSLKGGARRVSPDQTHASSVRRRSAAFSLVEVVIGAAVLGTLSVSLLGAFSAGLSIVQSGRQNMRATQILIQKMEAIRLFTWDQTTNTTLASTNFTDWYDPTRTNSQSGGV